MIPLLQKKMIFLTIAAATSPSLTMIKFSSLDKTSHYKIMVNYNGQADLLLSLQIPPDYYPYQFKQRNLYDYLTNINKYIIAGEHTSSEKKQMAKDIQKRLDELVGQIKAFGPSLWNEDLYEGGLVTKNEQMWSSKTVDYLFLEQFVLDDSADPLFLTGGLPKHKNLIVTNFRAARDPYTLFNEKVFKYFLDKSKGSNQEQNGQSEDNHKKLAEKMYEYYKKYSKLKPDTIYRTAKYMEFWNSFCSNLNYLKNQPDFKQQNGNSQESDIKHLLSIPITKEKIFSPSNEETNEADKTIAELFASFIFDEDEKTLLKGFINGNSSGESQGSEYTINYLSSNSEIKKAEAKEASTSLCSPAAEAQTQVAVKVHHPALEHSTLPGSSPVSEGTQKDLMVYLAQIATSLYSISKSSSQEFESIFSSDPRKDAISNALKNSLSIAKEYKERLKNIRDFFKSAGLVDSSFDPEKNCYKRDGSKKVAIVSYPPAQLGAGNSTIQTVSKYPFIYRELGLKEVLPNSLSQNSQVMKTVSETPSKSHLLKDKGVFGIDDNGWWWNLGDFNFSGEQLSEFKESADSIIFVATEDDWNILSSRDNPKLDFLKKLLKPENGNNSETSTKKTSKFDYSNYHLWNEGLRSPIALNLLLDNLVDLLVKQFAVDVTKNNTDNQSRAKRSAEVSTTNGDSLKQKYEKAMNWGDYWNKTFLKKERENIQTKK